MPKSQPANRYKCSECGREFPRWFGKCPSCGEFSTAVEIEEPTSSEPASGTKTASAKPASKRSPLTKSSRKLDRFSTGIGELDRVLGGGFVQSEVALLGGSPGAGKSTLSLSIAESFTNEGMSVLYCSGEESVEQIGLRADRMGVESDLISVVNTSSLEDILGHIDEMKPDLFIVDSLQTVASSALSGSLGSIQQSKEAAHVLNSKAKSMKCRAILVSQATKGDDYAGSLAIQHVTDVSLVFETSKESPLRFLRSLKNRFGSIDEVGIFQHSEKGLEQVSDPSGLMMEQTEDLLPGVSYGVISEGIRHMPIEVQALVTTSALPNPRKQFSGVQHQRGSIICAALDKFCGLKLGELYDVYVSTIFGARLDDPLSDLSVAAAILSSRKDTAHKVRTAYVGEISLAGQIRGTHFIESKVQEARRMGFERIVIPAGAKNSLKGIAKEAKDIRFISKLSELESILKAS